MPGCMWYATPPKVVVDITEADIGRPKLRRGRIVRRASVWYGTTPPKVVEEDLTEAEMGRRKLRRGRRA